MLENYSFSDLVGVSIGRASMCWSETPRGVFDSTKAKMLYDRIVQRHEHLIREARATIERLTLTLIEVKKDIEANAEDTLWVHGGLPMTICDRIDIELDWTSFSRR